MTEDRLEQALADHREASAASAATIDVSHAIRDAIAQPAGPTRGGRGWLLAPALAVAAAAALLLWIVVRDARETVVASGALSADGVALAADGETTVVLPASFVAGERSGGTLRSSESRFLVWPSAELTVTGASTAANVVGGVTVTTPRRDVTLATSFGQIRGRGAFDIETKQPGHPMTLTKNHKLGITTVLAISVAAGWVIFRDNDGNETRIDEPGTAAIASGGKVTRLGERPADGALVASRSGAAAAAATDKVPSSVSGAFWDESEKRIVFALAGEVIDAVSGAPIESFDLSATPTKSQGFGQGTLVRRSFSERRHGDFVLNNLGLGTWRVEIRAAGYAPSSQSVKLGDLYANPLLLFPLTEGAQVTGQVLDWKGRPVEGARVGQPACLGEKAKVGCAVALSDKDGAFVLPAVPEDQTFSLRAEHKKYGFAELKALHQAEGSNNHVVIRLSGVLRIYGNVTRGKSASPVAGAIVGVRSGQRATTSATGSYELLSPLDARTEAFVESDPSRPKARGKIVSYPDNRSARELRWVDAETHVAEVEIGFQLAMESGSISGIVVGADGTPVAGVDLRFRNTAGWKGSRTHATFPTSARTDTDGRYRINDVPASAGYRVGYRTDEADEPVVLGFVSVAREENVVANFTIGSGTIRGRFVAKSGERFAVSPRGCARLGATSTNGVHLLARCYDDGRFEFLRVAPGTYTLENRLSTQASPIEIAKIEIVVKPGEIVEGVEVVATGDESQTWRLRILDRDGRFVAGVGIRYSQGNTMFTSSLEVKSDGIARVALSKQYDLINIDAPGYQSLEVRLKLRDPSDVIELRMERKESQ